MTLTELQNQALKLPLSEKWHLVQSLLKSIEEETHFVSVPYQKDTQVQTLHPWTQSLIGIIQEQDNLFPESYVNYLEEKYR
ncbi:hypothetical protein ACN4EE_05940 [Geminocystis sp. CENA526]|uniref:hypothetical protein n=1 Tax=Geminocystis sp. CENA526 TaxID=1355871 RepID=UPI003D6F1AB7